MYNEMYPSLDHAEHENPVLFLPSQTQAATHLFTVSVVLPFPECHAVEVTQYVAFSDWLLSLSNMHLRFLPSLPGLIAHFFLVLRLDVI